MLVSELMLQQTQVPGSCRRYRVFLARFPTPAACAAASVGDVVSAWSGLGYNRRAVNLHRCARPWCARSTTAVCPTISTSLLALPGIGPYTARAVLVFAYGRDVGLVDTNAGRFVAGAPWPGDPFVAARRRQSRTRGSPRSRWAWGQAVFDLGAIVCTEREPGLSTGARRTPLPVAAGRVSGTGSDRRFRGISGPQSTFEGSFRQGRGRLLARLTEGPVAPATLATATGWPDDPERAARAAASLIEDGLAARRADGSIALP